MEIVNIVLFKVLDINTHIKKSTAGGPGFIICSTCGIVAEWLLNHLYRDRKGNDLRGKGWRGNPKNHFYSYSSSISLALIVWWCLQYIGIPQEELQGSEPPPRSWPTEGKIEFEHVTLKYKPELPPALSDVSFLIASGMQVWCFQDFHWIILICEAILMSALAFRLE